MHGNNQLDTQDFLDIIKAALHQEKSEIPVTAEILNLAKSHNLSYMVYAATDCDELRNPSTMAIAKSMTQLYAAEELEKAFEESGVDISLVKGVYTKRRYSDSSFRTMGDIDFLIKPNQNEQVVELLSRLEYESHVEGRKHDIFFKKLFLCLEVHRDLVDGESEFFEYYRNAWIRLELKAGYQHVYEMSLEDEYIFNILHLVGHFKHCGIGVRFLTDIYTYEHLNIDRAYIKSELKLLRLDKFYDFLCELSLHWFGTSDEQEVVNISTVLEELEEYIFSGGVFGTSENSKNVKAERGKVGSLLKSVFPGYDSMKSMYTWLVPALLPVAWVMRGISAFRYRRTHIHSLVNGAISGDREKGREIIEFFERCGLE